MKTKPAGEEAAHSRYMVPVVRSTFRILHELSRSGSLSLNEVTLHTGVAKSTVFRILTSLYEMGYVLRDARQRAYYISSKLAGLIHPDTWSDAVREAALPHMLRLRDEFGETVNLGKMDADRVVYLEVVPSEHALRLCERPGGWEYVHSSALGKAMLAFAPLELAKNLVFGRDLPSLTPNTITHREEFLKELARVRKRGYAFDDEETTLLGSCVGAPILDGQGVAIAALSVSGPRLRFNPHKDKRLTARLVESAAAIAAQLGHSRSALASSKDGRRVAGARKPRRAGPR
ncbi:MAG TPA: IclR family transcriptional regulator [Bryobacterales bacterium]|nr:IclR family transcriptional regulator [Bryobacterales bacterium]